jgi:hypothetical protein
MEKFVDLHFSPELKVVTAVDGLRGSGCLLLGGLLVLALFGLILGSILTGKSNLSGIWVWLMIGVISLTLYFLFERIAGTLNALRQRRLLMQKGIRTQASVVGRESDETNENDDHFIYYQFHSDFVAKYLDSTKGLRFFNLSMGDTLPVLYLPENPEVTGVVFQ